MSQVPITVPPESRKHLSSSLIGSLETGSLIKMRGALTRHMDGEKKPHGPATLLPQPLHQHITSSPAHNQSHAPEKAMAPHSSTLAWKIPRKEEPGGLQSMGLRRTGYNWATSRSLFTFTLWRRKWQPHSSVLAWRIPGTGEPGGLPSMGSHRVGHDWSDLAAAVVSYFTHTRTYTHHLALII